MSSERHALNNQVLYRGLTWDPDHPFLRYLEGGTVHTLDLGPAVTSAWTDQPLVKVLLSPDGTTLAHGIAAPGRDTTTHPLKVWDTATLHAAGVQVPLQSCTVDPARAVSRICARTGGADLTRAQWHTYVPDSSYRRVCGS